MNSNTNRITSVIYQVKESNMFPENCHHVENIQPEGPCEPVVEMEDVKPGDMLTIVKGTFTVNGIVKTITKTLSETKTVYQVWFADGMSGNPYLILPQTGYEVRSKYRPLGHASEEGPQAATSESDSTPDMIRITDLHDLREGDIVHFHHGTWKSVGVFNALGTSDSYDGKHMEIRFHDDPTYISGFSFAYKPEDSVETDCVFDYAERRAYDSWTENDLPQEPGFYRAATGSVWKFDGEVFSPVFDHNGELAPYAPAARGFSKTTFLKYSIRVERFPFIRVTLTMHKWSQDYKDNGQYSPDSDDADSDDASEADF